LEPTLTGVKLGAMIRTGKAFLVIVAALCVGGAAPRALAPATGGLWDVGRSADGHDAQRLCLRDPAILAQWEHRTGRCTRVILSDQGSRATIHYTCADGGFGRSDLELLTPRTIRVDTQGISGGYPFAYTLHARRVGDCPAH
jgi:hypothetical protein